jgi:hypothetical protein
VLLALAATVAKAAECSGYDVLVTQSAETEDLGGGHQLVVVRQSSVVITDDKNSMLNQTTGECHGSILMTPDGSVKGSGHCGRQDADGDTYSLEWSLAPGAERGQWKLLAGTGKFANASGSGWFQQTVADDPMSVSVWGGDCN